MMNERAKIGLVNAIYKAIAEGEEIEAYISSNSDGRITIHYGSTEAIEPIKQWMLQYASAPEEEIVTEMVKLDGKKQ